MTFESQAISLSGFTPSDPRIELAVVLPTYNESKNIGEVLTRLDRVLRGINWEVIVVDDDSPDGTSDIVCGYALKDARVRLLHRVGRRGLSSACIEGIMATSANWVAVMDADLQHDETILPQMLALLKNDGLDVVVGTRNSEGGSMGDFSKRRKLLSRMGERISQSVCRLQLSDPMSGFFVVRRGFFLEVVHQLQGGGFKILVDILSSSTRPIRFGEIGYTFRNRTHGDSKLDVNAAVEYLFLVINKMMGGTLPVRFAVFALVGGTGLITHFICLFILLKVFQLQFVPAQVIATFVAMTENFFLNNLITYRDRKLRGPRLWLGLVSFWMACSFGAWANTVFAESLVQAGHPKLLAGVAGIIISSVWNYSVSGLFTWQMPKRKRAVLTPSIPSHSEAIH